MKTIKVRDLSELPTDFTGIAEYPNGSKSWYLNGKLHRTDGPAYEGANGSKQWYLNGNLHREDGPTWEWADGSKSWCLNGHWHRVDGPAIEYYNGTKEWYLNHKRIYRLEPIGEYLLIEDGLPSDVEWLGKRVTQRKVLTATGFMYIPNLPGME
jgi:hypothetical protein